MMGTAAFARELETIYLRVAGPDVCA